MPEKILPMLKQFVQTPIQVVFLRQAEVLFQQIGHGAVLKPLSMQSPFAAGINQPIGRQGLQHMAPAGLFS